MANANATKPLNTISINDLTSKYQQKIDNYNSMINTMSDEQKQLFQIAINIFDIQKRQEQWDSYIGYALKTLLMHGFYYDVINQSWSTCFTPSNYVNPDPQIPENEAYERYVRTLYPREACQLIGVSMWDIVDASVNLELVKKAQGGEMAYEYFDLEFAFGGEQKANVVKASDVIAHPVIPLSAKANIDEMTKGDNSPDKFIYAYTDSGVSKNKRDWRPMIMDRIAQQVMDNMPPGNFGHVNPKDIGYELPLPVVTWIGATTELLPDGINKRLWLKGYVIPVDSGVQLKTFVRAKAINSISVFGGLTLLPNEESDILSVLDIDLKSIDISGKLKEGLNSGITELAGEMHDPLTEIKNEEQEANDMDLKNVTLAELRASNPQLFGEMKTAVIADMDTEANQKVILTKAGEMDTIVSELGDKPIDTAKQYKAFVGEMAEAVGLQTGVGIELPTLSNIVEAVKNAVGKVTQITSLLKPAEGQDVVAKAQEISDANRIAQNTQAVDAVKTKFDELTSSVSNEAIKNLVAMQFNGILNAKPESISEDFLATSTAKLEAEVPTVLESVVTTAQALVQTGQAAGEMALYDNLGVGKGANANQKPVDQMSDVEYAKHLGYGID